MLFVNIMIPKVYSRCTQCPDDYTSKSYYPDLWVTNKSVSTLCIICISLNKMGKSQPEIWEEVIVVYFKVLFQHLNSANEENNGKPSSG
jgi:hypothetical protein